MRVIYIGQTDCESGKDLTVCDYSAANRDELINLGLNKLHKPYLVVKDKGKIICAFNDVTGEIVMARGAHSKYTVYECPKCQERTQGSHRGLIIDEPGTKHRLCPACTERR